MCVWLLEFVACFASFRVCYPFVVKSNQNTPEHSLSHTCKQSPACLLRHTLSRDVRMQHPSLDEGLASLADCPHRSLTGRSESLRLYISPRHASPCWCLHACSCLRLHLLPMPRPAGVAPLQQRSGVAAQVCLSIGSPFEPLLSCDTGLVRGSG